MWTPAPCPGVARIPHRTPPPPASHKGSDLMEAPRVGQGAVLVGGGVAGNVQGRRA